MQCRHTVPDWHRYVEPEGDAVPIFAGCRLLVKEGELARDPRSIACACWGHQRDCPLFDGPGATPKTQAGAGERPACRDVPVAMKAVWPVRAPGAKDAMRHVLIGLGMLSTAAMLVTLVVGLAVLSGRGPVAGYLHVTLMAATVSIVTHVLAMLRAWARR